MAFGETFYRLLIQSDVSAITHDSTHITMSNLKRAGGFGNDSGGEGAGVNIEDLRPFGTRLQHGVILSQQISSMLLFRKQQGVLTPLKHLCQGIQTTITKHQITISKPHPVCRRGKRGTVSANASAKQLLLRDGLPVPGNAGRYLITEKGKKLLCLFVFRTVENRHGDIQLFWREQHQRAQLVNQKMRIVPAMADYFQFQVSGARSTRILWRQVRLEPPRRNPASGRKPEKGKFYQVPHSLGPGNVLEKPANSITATIEKPTAMLLQRVNHLVQGL
ncbi:hypothetical protein [Marinobacter fuscus]|uniref:hypothetical protein n=1 Tax=Marinobacter fuscus TaxID=2109942 RepID=UPI0013FD70EA|nr:hypothetical protein [Marinobacter fuscus]